MQRQEQPLAVLDGLRGLAALIVVASHASGLGLHLVPGLDLTGIGKPGVYLFFVLSAFLLTRQCLRAMQAQRFDGAALRQFMLRRLLRIYPLYVLVLLVGWALAPRGLGVSLDGAAVARHLLLLEGRDIYWSVPVEFMYYLCIPPLAWGLTRPLGVGFKLAALLAIGLGAAMIWPPRSAPLNSAVLGYYLPILLCGSLAAWWGESRRNSLRAGDAGSRFLSSGDVSLLLLLALSVPSVHRALGSGAGVDALHRWFLGWGMLWSLVLTGLLAGRLPAWRGLLEWSGLQRCGHWCFGIYLLHMPALYLAKRLPLPASLQAWLALALALAVAAAAHRWIERPCQRLAGPAR